MTRQLSHQPLACHCTFDHAPEDGCLWAKWDDESYIIQRCHRQRVDGGNYCLLHFIVNVTVPN